MIAKIRVTELEADLLELFNRLGEDKQRIAIGVVCGLVLHSSESSDDDKALAGRKMLKQIAAVK